MNLLTNKIIMIILPTLLKSISPILVAQMQPLLDQLKETAKSTQNPWDDILVYFLEEILKEFINDRPRD